MASVTSTLDTSAADSPGDVAANGDEPTPDLQQLAKAFGLDFGTSNALMKPDMNFLQELAQLPVNWGEQPAAADVQGWRDWDDNTLASGPLAEYRNKTDLKRRRPAAKVNATDISIKCTDDGQETFTVRVWVPERDEEAKSSGRPAVLFFHGGGWTHGNARADEGLSEFFASELDAAVFGVDYRLAPEHPFPLPLDDCTRALVWVIRNAAEYNVDPTRIGILGGSAGGQLAASLALRCSRPPLSGKVKLRMVSLVVPVTAHPKAYSLYEKQRTVPKSDNELAFASEPAPSDAIMQEFDNILNMYLGDKGDALDPLVSPLLSKAEDLSNHPPTHITVAACDVLRDQALAYGQLLRSAGVRATEEILPGVPHGFTFPTNAAVTKKWCESQRDLFMEAFQ